MHRRIFLRLVWISVLALLALKAKVHSESVPTAGTNSAGEDIKSDSLLLLCTADGSIFVLDAWTGKLQSKSRTGFPLLTRSVSETHNTNNDGDSTEDDTIILANHIVPGLDGKLYWQEHDIEEQDDDDDQDELPLQPLPLSISSLLAHPVRTCSENQNACGILHAAEHTVLYGLDPQSGSLQWSTRGFFGNDHVDDDTESSEASYLILQRKDVSIQQISSRNGRQLWNITMGSYQAVDFDADPSGSSTGGASSLLDDDDDSDNNDDPGQVISQLPSLAFLHDGRQLVAVTRDTNGLSESFGPILWRVEAPSRVASIFGILGGRWHPIHILDGFYERYDTPKHLPLLLSDVPFTTNAKNEWLDAWMKEEVYRLQHEQFAKQHDRFYPRVQGLLPAPDSIVKLIDPPEYPFQLPSIPITVVPPDGLVLSWDFVKGMIFCLTLLLVLIVSVIKRQKLLLRRAQLRVNLVESARRNPPKDSQSLPGSPHKGSVSKAIQSDPGEITVVASKSEAGALVKTSEETASADESAQQGVTQQGGIPLVRYARFRSEFEQMQALGKGGFGSVFRCRNNLDGREYAIKKVCIRRKSENDVTFNQRLQRVLREVKILAVLDHPNIVRYYTAWLEVENGLDEETENPEDGASQCFSSSYLTNQTATDWGKGRAANGISRSQWSADNDSQSSDIFVPRVPLHRSPVSGEDLGFIFEESNEDEWGSTTPPTNRSVARGIEPSESNSITNEESRVSDNVLSRKVHPAPTIGSSTGNDKTFGLRHTLYIQMQLCSFDNLSDFVADPNARKGSMAKGIDVSLALRLFLQIVKAVQYCHEKGLIHRDLKPTNCFVDETGRIKVGDFGLSRESSDKDGGAVIEITRDTEDDQTAGVGTRLYASPEQSAGSSYDSSTDVFSLGIILFELCYPMYTGMERNICISRLRDKHEFPPDWETFVSKSFPTLRDLIISMLSKNPEDRPKASAVAEHVQEVLGQLTIISVGNGKETADDLVLLRVEADSEPDTLANTMEQIRQAALPESIDILQYGLSQTKDSHTIMEFALRSSPGLEAAMLVSRLKGRPRILTAREVSVSR